MTVYDSFFRAVSARNWHGRNFNALRDSIATGAINAVEVPFTLVIQNYDKIAPSAKQMADDFVDECVGAVQSRSSQQENRVLQCLEGNADF